MQITRETDYALRSVHYLARQSGRVCMVEEIAAAMEVPRSFLAKIIQKLAREGLVGSRRGAGGGYVLARPAAEITFYDVISAIEGPPIMNLCALEPERCERSGHCRLHPIWVQVRSEVEEVLRARNFAQF